MVDESVEESLQDQESAVVSVRGASEAVAAVREFDPITTEVIRHALDAATAQMALSLKRTAFSPIIYEVNDFACALYDRDVRLLSQAQIFPLFLGTLGFCVESAVAAIGGPTKLDPGDVIFTTYAYDIGSHQQDAAVVVPGFVDGELVGYAVVKAHHMDIGAKAPYCTDTTDIFQEGTIFPAVRVYRRGELQEEMYRTLLANSRLPEALAGDLHAEIGAARIGLQNLYRVIEKYGGVKVGEAVEQMFDHAEARIRRFVDEVPDGRYIGHGQMDDNGITSESVPLRIEVEVRGADIVVDFTQSAPEQPGPVNCPLPSTVSAARMAIMALAGGTENVNEGHFRAIEVRAKKGTMYHPEPPAPVYLYFWSALQAVDVIHRAFTDELPTRVGAGSSGDICCIVWWGQDRSGKLYSHGANHWAGQGATIDADGGAPLIHIGSSGMRNSPVEVWEARYPMIIDRLELSPDTGGVGEFQGGLGIDLHYRALLDCYLTATLERTKTPAWGLQGGGDGAANHGQIRYPDGQLIECNKGTGVLLPAGAVYEMFIGSGGGYGPPESRKAVLVQQDIRAGYVTEDHARRQYPSVFSGE